MKYSNEDILKICKQFANGIGIQLKGSYWAIVEPLSVYLNACGINNTLKVYDKYKVIQIEFADGRVLIPEASSLPIKGAKDWMWLEDLVKLIK